MGVRLLAGVLAALLVPATQAVAQGDPIMPLDEVRPGMECTGYSVIRGTEPVPFDVEVIDIVGGEGGARILVEVSGEAVDDTGIGAGFSGSPIYCPDEEGTERNAGAISETIGDYGGFTVLATPIELILGASPEPAAGGQETVVAGRPLATPLTAGGLSQPVFAALARRLRQTGRTLLQAPPVPLQAPSPAANPLRPGSAVGIGMSSGDVSIGAVGTVAYVDGQKVWTLGHQFDAVGPRNLFLQNAYVAAVIANPVQLPDAGGTYKLAGATEDIGIVTDDIVSAVAGRVGGLPASIPVRIFAQDDDTDRQLLTSVQVADESSVATPTGASSLSFIGPVSIAQAVTELYPFTPTRVMGTMCLRIVLRERRRPIRLCNRYVADGTDPAASFANVIAVLASADASEALALLDTYKPAELHVAELSARVRVRRGQHQAFIRSVRVPPRARPGQMITARLRIQRVRGARETVSFRFPAPRRTGLRQLVFRGRDADIADDELFGILEIDLGGGGGGRDTTGPKSIKELVREMRKVESYDGVRVNGRRRFRSEELRIGGRAEATIQITR